MALTKLDPNVIGQDSTGTGKITSAGGSVSVDSSGNVRIANTSANNIVATSGGYLGIGTTPAAPLHVKTQTDGNLWIRNSAAVYGGQADGIAIDVLNDSNSGVKPLAVRGAPLYLIAGEGSALSLHSNNGTVGLTLAANSNIGVGNTTPSYKLFVQANTPSVAKFTTTSEYIRPIIETTGTTGSPETSLHFSQAVAAGGTKDYYMGIYTPSAGRSRFYFDNRTSLPVDFEVTGSPKMTIDTSGNVGIGYTAPLSKLHVVGTIVNDNSAGDFARTVYKCQGKSGTYTTITIDVDTGGAGGWCYEVQSGGTGNGNWQTGGGYINGAANFSQTTRGGSGWTVSAPSGNIVRFVTSTSVGVHPVAFIRFTGSLSQQTLGDSAITITFS